MFTEVCRDVPSSLSYPVCKFVMVFHFSKCVLTLPCASVSTFSLLQVGLVFPMHVFPCLHFYKCVLMFPRAALL